MSTFNEAMIRPGVSCLEDNDECMVYVLYSRLGKTMQKGTKLVCRKTLTRHLINRQEGTFSQPIFPEVITMGDVINSTLMHINDLPRPYSTLTRHQRGLILTLYDYLCYCI